ncbi:hypothetical protein [Streptomyces laurentii]|uniref:hypothetical protein n=1 Tax=Streptomyces laurentii TaxID=39478 RepID=UPI0036D1BDD6
MERTKIRVSAGTRDHMAILAAGRDLTPRRLVELLVELPGEPLVERERTRERIARRLTADLETDIRDLVMSGPLSWARHLSDEELREFVRDLSERVRDPGGQGLHRTIVEWRATARILACPGLTAQLTRALPDEDHGEVPAPDTA